MSDFIKVASFCLLIVIAIKCFIIDYKLDLTIENQAKQQLEIACKQTESKAGLTNKVYLCVEN